MMKLFALLLATLLLLPGCSAIKVTYNQADTVAAWKADDYFDLDGRQKDALNVHLDRFHAWHRATQLAEYADLLESARKRLHAGVSTQDATWAIDSIKARYRVLVQRGYADAARVLSTLSAPQIEAARRQFDKDNRKYAQEFGVGSPPDEQRRLRAQRHIERIEHWTGPLTSAQDARLRESSRALPLVTELRHQDRMRRQREFLAVLAERKAPAFATTLRDWLLDWDRARSAEHDAQFTRFTEASGKLYVEVFDLLTAEQRAHVSDRLRRYIVALRELARETERTADATRP